MLCERRKFSAGSLSNSKDDTLSFNSFAPPLVIDNLEGAGEVTHDVISDEEIDSTMYTKRMMLSQSARVYDANGFISPFVLVARHLLQRAWLAKVDWSDVLPEDILTEFRTWVKQLPQLEHVKIDRLIVPKNNGTITEICVFNDACSNSFATCVYVIAEDSTGKRFSNLVFSKSKVKPLKKLETTLSEDLSIPRMELLACEIGARAGDYVRKALSDYQNIRMRYFSDSLVSLYRINNPPGGYKVWVANRLLNIQELTNPQDWYFVPGELNRAADVASRSAALQDFINSSFWLHGPEFLVDKNHQYITVDQIKLNQKMKQIDSGEKKVAIPTFHLTFVSHHMNLIDENQLPLEAAVAASENRTLSFYEEQNPTDPTRNGILYLKENWGKTVRIFGWVLRYVRKLQAAVKSTRLYNNSVEYKKKLRKHQVQYDSKQKKKSKRKVKKPTPWEKMAKVASSIFLTSNE